jgi:hypothetical protein
VASLGRVSLATSGGAARLRDEAPLEARARARRGPWALGRAQVGSGWHDIDAQAPEGNGSLQSGPTAVLAYSGERLREQQGREREIRGMGR